MNKYIDYEIILQRKTIHYIFIYIMIIILINLSLIIFFILFKYKTYYSLMGTIIKEEDKYHLKIYLPLDREKYLSKNTLLIDRKEYSFNMLSIDENYITDNKITYQIITLEISLPDKYKYNNLVLNLKILKDDKPLINYIVNRKEN